VLCAIPVYKIVVKKNKNCRHIPEQVPIEAVDRVNDHTPPCGEDERDSDSSESAEERIDASI
jgi:hypothetical protein